MYRTTRALFLLTVLFCMGTQTASSQELVYEFVNPSFGGSSFNGDWLMTQAQVQNGFTATSEDLRFDFDDDPLKDFEDSINRQVLNQISRELFDDLFGEDGLKDGKYEFGSYSVEISRSLDGINIDILDIENGGETSLIIPYF